MIFHVEQIDSVTCIKLIPRRATAEIAREFKDFLFDLIENCEIPKIVIDVEKVEFMDSFFLGAVVSGLKKSRLSNGDIKLADMQNSLLPIFKLMHLDEVFQIFPSKNDAINSFIKTDNPKGV